MMRRILCALLLAVSAGSALSLEQFAPSDAEIANLPPYCARRLKGLMSPQESAMYPSVHHYCFGLNFINRAARARDANSRSFNLTSAKGEISYTIKASPAGHWLLPQLYTDLGRTHVKLKERALASRAFSQAIGVNPAYEPAYRGLIETLRATGSQSAVLEVATSGLRHIPDSKYLQKAYLASGGKKPFPEPVSARATAPEDAVPQDVMPQVSPGKGEEQRQDGEAAIEPESAATRTSDAEAEEIENAAMGSGCRFCPPEEIQQRWKEYFETEAERP